MKTDEKMGARKWHHVNAEVVVTSRFAIFTAPRSYFKSNVP